MFDCSGLLRVIGMDAAVVGMFGIGSVVGRCGAVESMRIEGIGGAIESIRIECFVIAL